MKVVINVNYGGFCFPDEFLEKYNIDEEYAEDHNRELRADPRFVEWVKEARATYEPDPEDPWADDDFDLDIVEVPDNATDWYIREIDGSEDIIAIVKGRKIYIH